MESRSLASLNFMRSTSVDNALGFRRGKTSTNAEPAPTLLVASMVPPWASAIWRAMERPRPAPSSARAASALWKRSKIKGNSSSRIPTPLSETSSSTRSPRPLTPTVTLPPSGVYLTALSSNMEATWRIRPRSKVAMIPWSGGTNSTDSLPSALSLAVSTASFAISPRSWRPTSRGAPSSPRVRVSSDSTRSRILPASLRMARTLRLAVSVSFSRAHSSSILAWPLMEVRGVLSSWLASAAKRRWRESASSRRAKAASRRARRR